MPMAYSTKNKERFAQYVLSVYQLYKESDISDARIVAKKFPEHGIFISYVGWMNIKNGRPKGLPPITEKRFEAALNERLNAHNQQVSG